MKSIYLVITPFFPSITSFRGPFVLDQVKAIEKGNQFEVLLFKPKSLFSRVKDYEYEGIKVNYFINFTLPFALLPGLFDWLTVFFFFFKAKKMAINFENISVVHSHVIGNAFLANAIKKKNRKVKTVLQHHGLDVFGLTNGWFSRFKLHKKFSENYGIAVSNKIDLHVGVSSKTINALKSFRGIELKNTFVLYNGVDKTKFYSIKSKTNSVDKQFKIGCIANFWDSKDQITLIKAAENLIVTKKIPNLFISFIGMGYTKAACVLYVENKKIQNHFEFIDTIPHSSLVAYYNNLDLFVLPSYYEAFGCVYTEAYSCGVPFIAVKNQGISELIDADLAKFCLIDAKDAKKLEELIYLFYSKADDLNFELNIDINIDNLLKGYMNKLEELCVL